MAEMARSLIESFCMRRNLETADPYDLWKTRVGYCVKNLFNHSRLLGIAPAACLSLFDTYVNNGRRLFYRNQEYPIVRAFAAQTLLNAYEMYKDSRYLEKSKEHLLWLQHNRCRGFKGWGWGLGFRYAVGKNLAYGENTPLSTTTPYVLEALVQYRKVSKSTQFDEAIQRVGMFFMRDLVAMKETEKTLATSYAPMSDRIVTNAISYTMWSLAQLIAFSDKSQKGIIEERIRKLFYFVVEAQLDNGSWFYNPEMNSFIDCFHTCIILKNLHKTSAITDLPDCDEVIRRGEKYLLSRFFAPKRGLYRRFSKSNKPSLAAFDLYDNAEVLNLLFLRQRFDKAESLLNSICKNFFKENSIASQIDVFGVRHNWNMLRWAIMPFVYSLSVAMRFLSADKINSSLVYCRR
jgi:hypothetical protein